MPIIQSAKKKLRQDLKRTIRNQKVRSDLKDAVKSAQSKPTKKTLSSAYQHIDIAVKKQIIHKNKAARIKSRLARLDGKR